MGPTTEFRRSLALELAKKLVELLMSPDPAILVPTLRTVGNIVTGDDEQTDEIIQSGVLPCLNCLLSNSVKKSLRKEACWTISNITAGTLQQIRKVIEANLIPPIVHILAKAEFDIKKEAAWAICNATSGGSDVEIKFLVTCGCIPPLCELLACQDNRIVELVLDGLDNILKVGSSHKGEFLEAHLSNCYTTIIEGCGGLEKLEELLNHTHDEIADKAIKIIDNFFGDEDVGAAPEIIDGLYSFKTG